MFQSFHQCCFTFKAGGSSSKIVSSSTQKTSSLAGYKQQDRAWFEAAKQAEMAANHARAQ
jgi:hypothetical protein